MSDNDIQKQDTTQDPSALPENAQLVSQVPEFIINKKTGDMTIVDPEGNRMMMKATIIEEDDDDEEEEVEPLTTEEFRDALERLEKLGLTWTADAPSFIHVKNPEDKINLASEAFQSIQENFPGLPQEVHFAVNYLLTGDSSFADACGGIEALKEKAAIAREKIITPEFRSEFFFKHSIKVPYLVDIDWEVVLKFSEKNVTKFPAVAYGLLSLVFRERFTSRAASKDRHLTVAVNEELVDNFIAIFQEIKESLHASLEITQQVSVDHPLFEEEEEEEENVQHSSDK